MVKQGRTKLRKHRKTTGLQRRGRATQSAKPTNVLSGVSTRNTEGGDYGKFLHLKKISTACVHNEKACGERLSSPLEPCGSPQNGCRTGPLCRRGAARRKGSERAPSMAWGGGIGMARWGARAGIARRGLVWGVSGLWEGQRRPLGHRVRGARDRGLRRRTGVGRTLRGGAGRKQGGVKQERTSWQQRCAKKSGGEKKRGPGIDVGRQGGPSLGDWSV